MTLAFLSLQSIACGASETEPVAPPAETVAPPVAEAEPVPEVAEPERPDPGPAPEVEISVRDDLDGVTLVVRVTGESSLAGRVTLERASGETFGEGEAVVVPSALGLRASCGDPIPECRELIAGAELTPPAWTRKVGDDACGECRECSHAERGAYRFVVTSCNGLHRVESPTFHVR